MRSVFTAIAVLAMAIVAAPVFATCNTNLAVVNSFSNQAFVVANNFGVRSNFVDVRVVARQQALVNARNRAVVRQQIRFNQLRDLNRINAINARNARINRINRINAINAQNVRINRINRINVVERRVVRRNIAANVLLGRRSVVADVLLFRALTR